MLPPKKELPGNPQDLLREAIKKSDLGQHKEALEIYRTILEMQSDHPEALNNYGAALGLLRRDHEALSSLDRALEIRPDYVEALNNRGTSLARLGMLDSALASFDMALAIRPDYFDSLRNRGITLSGLGRYEDAILSYGRALAIRPFQTEVLTDWGLLLVKLSRYEDALAIFDQMLEINQNSVSALHNRGHILEKLMRYDEALVSYDRALEIKPDDVKVLDNRGIVLAKLARFDEALESEDAAQKIRPEYAKAHLHEGLTRLRMGDFRLGFRKYEWRWLDNPLEQQRREFSQPLWIGRGKLDGRTILLHAEQGLGDLIQFVRYVPLVAAKGAAVFLEVPEVLAPLVTGLSGVSRVLLSGEQLPLTDFHCPLLSLPLAFDTTLETIPASIPYLSVNPGASAEWHTRLAEGGKKLIGVCWRGSSKYKYDHERSIQFADFAPLLSIPGVRFVSLQKELNEEERRLAAVLPLVHPGVDFKSTAEMISSLDLVISVDTAWAHWAGAIGKPFWVLLPLSPHWVWLTERRDSPWYPAARLFRQSKVGDWKGVVRNVKKELAKWLDTV